MKRCVLLLVLAFAVPAAAQTAKHPAEDAFAADVSERGLQQMVRDLVALGPRMGGTPSGDQAAEFRRAYFKKLGLEAAFVDVPPVLGHWGTSWTLAIGGNGRLESAWPMGHSPSVAAGARGKIIYVKDLAAVQPAPEWA